MVVVIILRHTRLILVVTLGLCERKLSRYLLDCCTLDSPWITGQRFVVLLCYRFLEVATWSLLFDSLDFSLSFDLERTVSVIHRGEICAFTLGIPFGSPLAPSVFRHLSSSHPRVTSDSTPVSNDTIRTRARL